MYTLKDKLNQNSKYIFQTYNYYLKMNSLLLLIIFSKKNFNNVSLNFQTSIKVSRDHVFDQ